MTTVGEVVSRIKNVIKAVKQDAFITDRFIYSLVMKYGSMLMRRQDNQLKIMRFNGIFQTLNFVELIDIDKVDLACVNLSSGCYLKRTKQKLPSMLQGYYGPIIRSITTLDYSESIQITFPTVYERMQSQKTFRKYNKKKYAWYLDGYLYFPNINYDAVKVDGVFEGDISHYNCDETDLCLFIQDKMIPIPDFLFAEIEQFVRQDLAGMLQVPIDEKHDLKNIAR